VSVVTLHQLEIGVPSVAIPGRESCCVVRRSARLRVPDPRPFLDALIAATALVHGLTVVTRHVADFEPTGVSLVPHWMVG
jgi:predicted nucleic acid-binding protein